MQKIIKDFPILNQYIYANTAAYGIMYDSLLDWRQEHDLDYLLGGSNFKIKGLKLIEETRKTVGAFFNCKTENVALVQNVSLGFNILLEGLDKKNKVLLLESDFPSLNWPFESRGFEVSFVSSDNGILEDNIYSTIKNKGITVLAVSVVQWLNGIKIDLNFFKKLKTDFPNLLIIADGTQYCGTETFDFDNSCIDVLGASAYKWLLAGSGNGFMLFKEEVKKHFNLHTIGFNSSGGIIENQNNFNFIKHFEPGHLDTLSFGSLKWSLDYFTTIGKDKIETTIKELGNYAFKEFSKLNLLDGAVVNRTSHSTIFNIKGGQKLFDALANNNIICSQRGGGIRFSFHFYNTVKNIKNVIDVIKKNS